MSDMLRVKEVSELTGYTRTWIADLIRRGELPAVKQGKFWLLSPEAVDTLNRRLPPQRPSPAEVYEAWLEEGSAKRAGDRFNIKRSMALEIMHRGGYDVSPRIAQKMRYERERAARRQAQQPEPTPERQVSDLVRYHVAAIASYYGWSLPPSYAEDLFPDYPPPPQSYAGNLDADCSPQCPAWEECTTSDEVLCKGE